MTTYRIGQTVTRKGSETHGLVIDAWTNKHGARMVTIVTGRMSCPIALEAREVTPYVVQSPDTVILMDDRGNAWFFEVMDVTADGLSILIQNEDGALCTVPLTEVTRIIPASIARLTSLVGVQS
jgi:hypothetical protein